MAKVVGKKPFKMANPIDITGSVASTLRAPAASDRAYQILGFFNHMADMAQFAGFDYSFNTGNQLSEIYPTPRFTSAEGEAITKSRYPSGMPMRTESYTQRGDTVMRGEEVMTNRDYIALHAKCLRMLEEDIVKLQKDDPLLARVELDHLKKACLVSTGIIGPSALFAEEKLSMTEESFIILPEVARAYKQLVLKGSNVEALTNGYALAKHQSVPRNKGTGYFPLSTGQETDNNYCATIAAVMAAYMVHKRKLSITDIERMWGHDIPWYGSLLGTRASASGKVMPIYVSNGSSIQVIGEVKGLMPKKRAIQNMSAIVRYVTRPFAKAFAEQMYSTPFHPRDAKDQFSRFKKWANTKGATYLSLDYTNYDRHIGGKYLKLFLELWSPNAFMTDWLTIEMQSPYIAPAKNNSMAAFMYYNDFAALGSGMSSTSPVGSTTNTMLVESGVHSYFKSIGRRSRAPFEGYGSIYEYFIFGDDSVIAALDKRLIDYVTKYIGDGGFKIKVEEEFVFLMKYYSGRYGKQFNFASRVIQSFFQGEYLKSDPGIISLMIQESLNNLEGNPLKISVEKIFSYILSNYRFSLHKSLDQIKSWYMSDEMKSYLYDYSRSSSQAAAEVNDIFNAITSGLVAAGYDTDLVEQLFGIDYQTPKLEVDIQTISERDVMYLLNRYVDYAGGVVDNAFASDFLLKYKNSYKLT